jgi:hypothetical protein
MQVSEQRSMRSRYGWRGDIDLVTLELGHSPSQRAMLISRRRLLAELSIPPLSFPLGDSASPSRHSKSEIGLDFAETESPARHWGVHKADHALIEHTIQPPVHHHFEKRRLRILLSWSGTLVFASAVNCVSEKRQPPPAPLSSGSTLNASPPASPARCLRRDRLAVQSRRPPS